MILGFVDFIRFIFFNLFKVKNTKIQNSDEAEFVIRTLANKSSWNQRCKKSVQVESRDIETKKIIKIAKNKFDFLDFKPSILKKLD